ncbi:MAG: mannose-1-phosphate guanylyltransferase [Planctomycetota bacterium]
MNTFVAVLAGGAGTRFWPSGRRTRPKQLLPITGGRSMLAETLVRCAPLAPPEATYVVTNRLQLAATLRECPALPPEQVVAEPAMRNTAAAIGLAALHARRKDPEGVMIVLPADHFIQPQEAFEACFRAAVRRAREADVLLTIGIQPTGPATGYGYIESGEEVATIDHHVVQRVASFKEKPDAATAARFIATGRYFWNSGTFVWRIPTLLAAYEAHLPSHYELLMKIDPELDGGPAAADYERFESVPIDTGIMEKASNVEVIPALFEWDDVGSWLAIERLMPRDEHGNVIHGDHVGLDTRNCIVIGGDHLIATVGVEDLIVVHTSDATLICPKDRAEEVRHLVRRLEERGLEEYL